MTTGSENHREPVRNQWPTSSGNRFREVVYIDHRNRFRGPATLGGAHLDNSHSATPGRR
jgi:hypothetical protein